MIRLFSKLCKCFKQISFKNDLFIFNEYINSVDIHALVCPNCSAKHSISLFSSYYRHFVTYDEGVPTDNLIRIPRYICSSCNSTHALLPAVIIPYMSFSFNFTISLIYSYLTHRFSSISALCEHYQIAISTFYRIFKNFKLHKQLWLGLLHDSLISSLSFVQSFKNYPFIYFENFLLKFFSRFGLSFFQETS